MPKSSSNKKLISLKRQPLVLLIISSISFLLILIRLIFLQLLNYESFKEMSDENRIRLIASQPIRGKIIDKNDLERRKKNGPETLLIHGDADEVVPVSNILEAKDFLIRNNVSVNTKIIKNCGHHIPIEASSLALHFIKKNLEIK